MKQSKPLIRQFYRGNLGWFAAALAATLVLGVINLLISWLLQVIVDVAAGSAGMDLGSIALCALGTFLGFVAFFVLLRIAYPRFLRKAMTQYKEYAFRALTAKGLNAFSRESSGRYISALTNDATVIETDYLGKIFPLVQEILMFFGALAMMLWYSPLLTGVAVLLSILPVLASVVTGGKLAAAEQQVSTRNERFVATVKDLLTGFPVIKSFRAEAQAQNLFLRENQSVEQAKFRRKATAKTVELLGASAGVLAQLGVFLFGAWLAVSGRGLTPGTVLLFLQLMNFVIQPIGEVPAILAGRKAALALIDKLSASLQENVRAQGESIPAQLESGIEVRDLSFGYEEAAPVLRHVNLNFQAGKSYAIVGGSGSGKTTLLNLLTGSFDGYDGQILYDGRELRQISADALFSILTLVQQNVFVFNDTIQNNVTMFRDFPRDRVEQAMAQAGLSHLITTRGADYVCGENGSGLSGGEKQRISIARALLQGSPVLLMDEATSALDAATAFSVTNTVLDLQDMTRIVVTHRLEEPLLRRYDEILVLGGGTVTERGAFDQLMEKKGLFYALYTLAQNQG